MLAKEIDFEDVWDPACGGGTIIKALRDSGVYAIGSDFVRRWAADQIDRAWVQDFLAPGMRPAPNFTDIITNPPYSLAEAFIRRAFELEARKLASTSHAF